MWKPRDYDLEWSKKLFNSLKKDGGVWMFSATGKMNEPVLGTPSKPTSTATFTRNGNKMTLTDVKIVRLNDSEFMHNRINMAKTCFEAIGVECETESTVESAYLNLDYVPLSERTTDKINEFVEFTDALKNTKDEEESK